MSWTRHFQPSRQALNDCGMSDAQQKRRFVRVYFVDLERDYPDIWYDPTALSTWLRLLVASEKAWPAYPEIPRAARRADLEKLKKVGLMIAHSNDRFELKGWMVERESRAEKARMAVGSRTDRGAVEPTSVGTDVGSVVPTDVVPARAGVSPSPSISLGSTEGVQGEPDAVVAFHQRTGEVPGPKIRSWLDELAEAHGESRLASMIADTPSNGLNVPDYLRSVRDRLRLQDHAADRAEKHAEQKRVEEKRAPLKALPPAADISEADAKAQAAAYMARARS